MPTLLTAPAQHSTRNLATAFSNMVAKAAQEWYESCQCNQAGGLHCKVHHCNGQFVCCTLTVDTKKASCAVTQLHCTAVADV